MLPTDDPLLDEATRGLINWIGWDFDDAPDLEVDRYRAAVRHIAAVLAGAPLPNAPESLDLHERAWNLMDTVRHEFD
jgi:hypothetical protein